MKGNLESDIATRGMAVKMYAKLHFEKKETLVESHVRCTTVPFCNQNQSKEERSEKIGADHVNLTGNITKLERQLLSLCLAFITLSCVIM